MYFKNLLRIITAQISADIMNDFQNSLIVYNTEQEYITAGAVSSRKKVIHFYPFKKKNWIILLKTGIKFSFQYENL